VGFEGSQSLDSLLDVENDGEKNAVWRFMRTPFKIALLSTIVVGAALNIGMSNSEYVRQNVYGMKKAYYVGTAPSYEKLLSGFREAGRVHGMYGDPGKVESGRKMFCEELDRIPGYSCKKM